jgi:hypothetical protein
VVFPPSDALRPRYLCCALASKFHPPRSPTFVVRFVLFFLHLFSTFCCFVFVLYISFLFANCFTIVFCFVIFMFTFSTSSPQNMVFPKGKSPNISKGTLKVNLGLGPSYSLLFGALVVTLRILLFEIEELVFHISVLLCWLFNFQHRVVLCVSFFLFVCLFVCLFLFVLQPK